MKHLLLTLIALSIWATASADAPIILYNNTDVVVDGVVYGRMNGEIGAIMGAELQPGMRFKSEAAYRCDIYDVIWTEKGCGYHNHKETGCIWDEYLFNIRTEDIKIEVRPTGKKGTRVTHIIAD